MPLSKKQISELKKRSKRVKLNPLDPETKQALRDFSQSVDRDLQRNEDENKRRREIEEEKGCTYLNYLRTVKLKTPSSTEKEFRKWLQNK